MKPTSNVLPLSDLNCFIAVRGEQRLARRVDDRRSPTGTGSRRPGTRSWSCRPGARRARRCSPSTGWQPPFWMRSSSALPLSNSWLPTDAKSTFIRLEAIVIGSSKKRPFASGLAPMLSPAKIVACSVAVLRLAILRSPSRGTPRRRRTARRCCCRPPRALPCRSLNASRCTSVVPARRLRRLLRLRRLVRLRREGHRDLVRERPRSRDRHLRPRPDSARRAARRARRRPRPPPSRSAAPSSGTTSVEDVSHEFAPLLFAASAVSTLPMLSRVERGWKCTFGRTSMHDGALNGGPRSKRVVRRTGRCYPRRPWRRRSATRLPRAERLGEPADRAVAARSGARLGVAIVVAGRGGGGRAAPAARATSSTSPPSRTGPRSSSRSPSQRCRSSCSASAISAAIAAFVPAGFLPRVLSRPARRSPFRCAAVAGAALPGLRVRLGPDRRTARLARRAGRRGADVPALGAGDQPDRADVDGGRVPRSTRRWSSPDSLASLLAATVVGLVWARFGRDDLLDRVRRRHVHEGRPLAVFAGDGPARPAPGGRLPDHRRGDGGHAADGRAAERPRHGRRLRPLRRPRAGASWRCVMAICSEADAFIAASLTQFSMTARLAFMVVGPMVDVKLIALQSGHVRRRFAAALRAADLRRLRRRRASSSGGGCCDRRRRDDQPDRRRGDAPARADRTPTSATSASAWGLPGARRASR